MTANKPTRLGAGRYELNGNRIEFRYDPSGPAYLRNANARWLVTQTNGKLEWFRTLTDAVKYLNR